MQQQIPPKCPQPKESLQIQRESEKISRNLKFTRFHIPNQKPVELSAEEITDSLQTDAWISNTLKRSEIQIQQNEVITQQIQLDMAIKKHTDSG